jgi:uncharacterized protein (DUF1499 family)
VDASASSSRRTTLGTVALLLSVAGVLVLASAGPGSRFGLWHFRTGLGLLRYVVYLAGAGVVVGLLALVVNRGRARAAVAVIAGLAALAVPIGFRRQAASLPLIHDVSTSPETPLTFDTLAAQRQPTDNALTPPAPDVIAQQKAAYPDVAPLPLAEPPARVFERAVAAARDLGWEIAAADAARGHLEATDTTTWFGFKDDVVVQVRADGSGSRVDVRSVSRVGKSDVGANARRIRRYLAKLRG